MIVVAPVSESVMADCMGCLPSNIMIFTISQVAVVGFLGVFTPNVVILLLDFPGISILPIIIGPENDRF